MKDGGLDLFDPRISPETDPNSSPIRARDADFGFAFDDRNFSDRVLRIEIVSDQPQARPESAGACGDSSLAVWASRKSKRRRGDAAAAVKKGNALDINNGPEEQQLLDCTHLDVEDGACEENQDEEEMPMMEEDSPSGDEEEEEESSDDSDCPKQDSRVLQIKVLHISSPILAAKSPFFYKLFSNGMMESVQRHINLQISASEEGAFMDLLNFMYNNTLSANTAPSLLDVLMAADKFEVASCMSHCSHELRNLPMTPESALLYLELPSAVLIADAVQPLTDAARQFLADRYKDISKYQDEVMNLPLAGIEAVLSSDDLQVASEDAVYDFVLKWARAHYQNPETRKEILSSRLSQHIRFPHMTSRKLRKVLSCADFDRDSATKTVLEALFYKSEPPHRHRTSAGPRFPERAYKYRPVKILEFETPRQQCVIYLDLKKTECKNLFPSGRVYSQAFHWGGQGFFLSAHCNVDQQSNLHCFGLFLGMQEKGSVVFAVDYEFAARLRPTEEFVSKYRGNYTFTGGKAVGYRNLFGVPWASFVAEDSVYFIDDMLYLRAELTVKR